MNWLPFILGIDLLSSSHQMIRTGTKLDERWPQRVPQLSISSATANRILPVILSDIGRGLEGGEVG